MDRDLKERVVGAAVLVGLGVWLIPWFLDGPEQSVGTEPDVLELPRQTDASALRHQIITLNSDRDLPVSVAQTNSETALAGGADVQSSLREPVIPPVSAASNLEPGASLNATDEVGWFVQVGSYADEENARRQADRVSSYGFEASVSSFGSMQRVRVGPQSSREAAELVVSSLLVHGFVAQVVLEE